MALGTLRMLLRRRRRAAGAGGRSGADRAGAGRRHADAAGAATRRGRRGAGGVVVTGRSPRGAVVGAAMPVVGRGATRALVAALVGAAGTPSPATSRERSSARCIFSAARRTVARRAGSARCSPPGCGCRRGAVARRRRRRRRTAGRHDLRRGGGRSDVAVAALAAPRPARPSSRRPGCADADLGLRGAARRCCRGHMKVVGDHFRRLARGSASPSLHARAGRRRVANTIAVLQLRGRVAISSRVAEISASAPVRAGAMDGLRRRRSDDDAVPAADAAERALPVATRKRKLARASPPMTEGTPAVFADQLARQLRRNRGQPTPCCAHRLRRLLRRR